MLTLDGDIVFRTAALWVPHAGSDRRRAVVSRIAAELEDKERGEAKGYVVVKGQDAGPGSLGVYTSHEGYSLEATVVRADLGDGYYVLLQDALGSATQLALVAIENGQVMPGSGLIGSAETIRDAIQSLTATFIQDEEDEGGQDSPVVVSDSWIAEALDEPNARVVPLRLLLPEDQRVPIRSLDPAKLSTAQTVLIGGVFAGLLAGGGWYVWQSMQPEPQPVSPQSDPGLSEEERNALAREDYRKKMAQALEGTLPEHSDWPGKMLRYIEDRYSRSAYGWDFKGAECRFPSGCTLLWEGARIAPLSAMAEHLQIPADRLALDPQKGVLNLRVPLDEPGADLSATVAFSGDTLDRLPTASEYDRAWWELRQIAGLRVPGMALAQPEEPMKRVVSDTPPPGLDVEVYRGTTKSQGEGLDRLDHVTQILTALPANAVSLTAQSDDMNGWVWEIEVDYVGRK